MTFDMLICNSKTADNCIECITGSSENHLNGYFFKS